MSESNKMKEMPVNKLMIQMGIVHSLDMTDVRSLLWNVVNKQHNFYMI